MNGPVMNLGCYRLEAHIARRPRGRMVRPAASLVAIVSLVALGLGASPAGADNNATGTAALNSSGITSITVSPNEFDYDDCLNSSDGGSTTNTIQFPNGICSSTLGAVTITNGAAPATIEIQTTEFAPSDGTGPQWVPCEGSGLPSVGLVACAGPSDRPGVDQVEVENVHSGSLEPWFPGTIAGCDYAFQGSGCDAAGAQSASETLEFVAPTSSTDQSPTFSNTVTWIAVSS